MHLLQKDPPIRPLKGFTLNLPTILGLLGLTTTYIVLLQFKIEENKSN
jgi:hypothetical protein